MKLIVLAAYLGLILSDAQTAEINLPPGPEAYRKVQGEIETNLQTHILEVWFPRSIDKEHGGYYENFGEDWSRQSRNEKSIVCQSRLTWLSAQAAKRYPQKAQEYLAYSKQGLAGLENLLWDKEKGGFYWQVNENGKPGSKAEKHAYGVSFGIYAAAANYEVTHDPKGLELAKRAFEWLDKNAHDDKNGGYFEALSRDGKPLLTQQNPAVPASRDAIGTPYGYKSMNSHIHLLESFTTLAEVWPDRLVKKRLRELYEIVRDKVVVAPGCQNLYFTPDWHAVPAEDSYGHDVETAYLLVEAGAAQGKVDTKLWQIARSIIDHSLGYGWDNQFGGFYDAGTAFGAATHTDKIWWVQAEGLNALLLMHEHFGKETPKYWNAFLQEWNFIDKYQTDHKNSGWYNKVSRDGKARAGMNKGDAWTEGYHQGRALLNVTEMLERMNRGITKPE